MNRAMMALAVLAVSLCGQTAQAQLGYQRPITNPYQTPAFSPYLNLFRGGNPALNYYGIVRPQEQFYNYIETHQFGPQAQQTLQAQQQLLAGQTVSGPATFMSYNGYFLNVGGQRVGTPAAPPGGAPAIGGRGR
jgi:hypothetical protein